MQQLSDSGPRILSPYCQKYDYQGEAETATGKTRSFERNERRREGTFIRTWTRISSGHKSNENNGKKFISEP